jgi:hypothetical protein
MTAAIRKPRRLSPVRAFRTSIAALTAAYRLRDIEENRERLRVQAFPLPKRRSIELLRANSALRERKGEAITTRGNLIGHMLGYSKAAESNGLPRWCSELHQNWQYPRKLLEGVVVHRLPGTSGKPTPRTSFVFTEVYVLDEALYAFWKRGLAEYGLGLIRLGSEWRIAEPDDGLYKAMLVAAPEMIDRIRDFDRGRDWLNPRPAKLPHTKAVPDLTNVRSLFPRTAQP